MTDFESLLVLAQITITIAGFSSVVVVFRRREGGTWSKGDADRFHGLLVHSVLGTLFCIFPFVLNIFLGDPPRVWQIVSAILGIQIFIQIIGIVRMPSTKTLDRVVMLAWLLITVPLLTMNTFGIKFDHEFGPYLVGLLFHICQAGFLFIYLSWVSGEHIVDE